MTEIVNFRLFSLWGEKNYTNYNLALGFYRSYVSCDSGDHLAFVIEWALFSRCFEIQIPYRKVKK